MVKPQWDCFGVSKVSSRGCGVNHSNHNFKVNPKFIISNFQIDDDSDLYHWLFDLAQDSVIDHRGYRSKRFILSNLKLSLKIYQLL